MLLRLGIVLRGHLVEERIFGHTDVTVGRSARNSVVVPSDHLPERWHLFRFQQGAFVALPSQAMDVRVADDAGTRSVSPSPAGIPLGARTRGKLSTGDVTFLFQVLRPPPPQPRPQLPASVRSTVLGRLDRAFTGLGLVSLIAHLTMVLYLRAVDWPRGPAMEEVPERLVRWSIRRLPPKTETPAAAKPKAAPRTAANTRPAPRPASAAAPARSVEERRDDILKKVKNTGLLQLIGAAGENGAITDLLGHGSVDRDQEEVFRNVGGVNVATDDTGPLRGMIRPTGSGRVAVGSGLRAGAGIADAASTGTRIERAVKPMVHSSVPVVDGGKMDPGLISREVRGRMGALRACYERALKRTPTLAGKIVLRFTITAAGTVTGVTIDEDTIGDPAFVACLTSLVAAWRFPAPAEAPVEVSFPFVFQSADR